MTGNYWKKICAIPAYMFLLSPSGTRVQKMEGGNWIDRHEAQKVVDAAEDELSELREQADLYKQIQSAAGSLPSGWEIALRVENGYGGVDLIDPYGTVVDLDDVDSTLGESVAGAVAFAIAKEASYV